MKGFLYGQTEYNLLSNSVKLEEYISTAKKNQFDYLSITDPNLYGFYKFYKLCNKENIKPIIGLELEIINDLESNIFLLYAKNNKGLDNLFYIETFKNNNELTLDLLEKYSDNIAFILVVSKSFLTRSLISLPEEATNKLLFYRNKFKDLYLGISYQNKALEEINKESLALGRNIGILSLYVHEMRYLKEDDKKVYLTLKSIDNKDNLEEGDYTFFNPNIDFINDNRELFDNLDNFISSINYKIVKKEAMPKYDSELSSEEQLTILANKGLNKRLFNSKGNISKYKERLDYELKIINEMHFADYFLIVWDFIKWAKKGNIFVGPGRGSAASSLVAYSLGITEINPIKYNLLFERFLNPERVTMPDIDTDFPDNKRDEVIKYVQTKYGKYHVANINTFGTFSYKSSLRDVTRVYKLANKEVVELNNLLQKYKLDELLNKPDLSMNTHEILRIIKGLDTLPRNTSTHASGIIISGRDLREIIPLTDSGDSIYQTELEYDDLKELGLLKMDFLGIKNLTIIANILEDIGVSQIQFRNINLEDPRVYRLLQNADTLGIFQLESAGIRRVLTKLKPTKFTDIVAVLALYRPGPMDNIDEFIARKHGKKFNYLHEDLKPILEETYGIIVYQEQIMQIATKFAGYSLGKADILRRAISNKDVEEMKHLKEDFITSSIKQGYKKELANTIFELILKFANYGFNKSHSVAYALVSYEMAFLKVYYFDVFMANILNNVIGAKANLALYINYAREHNLIVVGPDINISTELFVVKDNKLYAPLSCIEQVGLQVSRSIIQERKNGLFKSYLDFISRVDISENIAKNLIYAGAFNSFKPNIKNLIENRTISASRINNLIGLDLELDENDYSFEDLAREEKKVLGFNLSYNPYQMIKDIKIKYKFNNNLTNIKLNRIEKYIVMFTSLSERKTNKGTILKGKIYDEFKQIDFVMFDSVYTNYKAVINEDNVYIVELIYKQNKDFPPVAYINNLTLITNKN